MKLQALGKTLMLGVSILLVVAAVAGDFLSTNPPSEQNLNSFYAPPTRIHFVDTQGRIHWRPFVYRYELTNPLEAHYDEKSDTMYALEFFAQGWRYEILGIIPASRHLVRAGSGGTFYPFGADALGRDVAARVLAGTRTSAIVVLLGLTIYAILGVTIGAVAGMLGGWTDGWLMRLSEFILAVPALYLILALQALLPDNIPYWQSVFLSVGTMAVIVWPPMARGVRGLILQLRSAGYVEVARSLGGTRFQVFARHLLPALLPFVLTQTALAAPFFILGEVLLSFLGVGFQRNDESWGAMLRNVTDLRVITDYWWNLAPLLFIFATLLALNAFSTRHRSKVFDRFTL